MYIQVHTYVYVYCNIHYKYLCVQTLVTYVYTHACTHAHVHTHETNCWYRHACAHAHFHWQTMHTRTLQLVRDVPDQLQELSKDAPATDEADVGLLVSGVPTEEYRESSRAFTGLGLLQVDSSLRTLRRQEVIWCGDTQQGRSPTRCTRGEYRGTLHLGACSRVDARVRRFLPGWLLDDACFLLREAAAFLPSGCEAEYGAGLVLGLSVMLNTSSPPVTSLVC